METAISFGPSVLTTLTVEIIKRAYRNYKKDLTFDFPNIFYQTVIPFILFLWSYLLGLGGFTPPVAFDVRTVVTWLVNIMFTILFYEMGLKPTLKYNSWYNYYAKDRSDRDIH